MRLPEKYLSNGKRNERNTYLYFIVAFQFRKPVKAAHIKDALFYSIGFHCWFARDVTAAMLVVKNKSISLLWELNSIFMKILREKVLLY